MDFRTVAFSACAVLVLAGCASNQAGTTTHLLRVELSGADSASCVSPQAMGDQVFEAPASIRVEPEQPIVEVICNAEGYQETYAGFEEAYTDGSAGRIAGSALAFGLIGAAIAAGQDNIDALPYRVVITMVPEGETRKGALAVADYDEVSESVLPLTYVSPAYTRAAPPEGSELAKARAAAESSLNDDERAKAQQAKLDAFQDKLRSSNDELVALLNSYNRSHDFSVSELAHRRLKIKDVSKLKVLDKRSDGYVVRIVGNSGLAESWSDDVYDELFLIEERAGRFVILDHGESLEPASTRIAGGASDGPTTAKLRRFEQRLKASRTQLTKLLNSYNYDAGFILRGGKPLKIKDASLIIVVGERGPGVVVRIVGNSGLGPMWSTQVYDEYFLIEDRGGGFAILDHGKALSGRQMSAVQ